jgi:NAD(P)-dependent dehydrogenase (short-subunit alcohol dehydrogenase family)
MPHSDKIMVVTGGSRGIGRATAERAAERGFHVCISYRIDAVAAEETVERIKATGGTAVAVQCDVLKDEDIEHLFEVVDNQPGRLSVLVNNAGIVAPQAAVVEMTRERLERMFQINVIGCFLCAKAAISRVSTRSGGAGGVIVNLSSVASRLGSPGEYVDYAASKAAIDTFTVGLAREVAGDGIRVNAVRPGLVYTDIHRDSGEPGRADRLRSAIPMQRVGNPGEIAEAVLWLASDKASYSTGAILDVAGGR